MRSGSFKIHQLPSITHHHHSAIIIHRSSLLFTPHNRAGVDGATPTHSQ
jgi:hypothetical protein